MPLTEFQARIAELLAANRTPDSYLAGGAALHIEPNSVRYSNDLDYFHDSAERVGSAYDEDRALLEKTGLEVRVLMQRVGFVRSVVAETSSSTKVEWAHDSAWRFLPPVRHPQAGFCLHPIDLAVNKLLALIGRNEPRDFLDTLHVHREVLPLGAVCWAAAGKDPGFTPPLILSRIRRRGAYRPEDFASLRLRQPVDLTTLKTEWLSALEQAEGFIASRPAEEIGCLYYSRSLSRFVGSWAADANDVVPHYGRPGGVLPVIVDRKSVRF
ncbi:MAG: hypothetical protein JW940_07925 [Polyangiaceae bacterium]|nr:hypothetical protein [Polyangiaceae bacterium]